MRTYFYVYTPCQVLREAYHILDEMPQNDQVAAVKDKLRLAVGITKAVTKRLYKFDPNYLDMSDKTKDVTREDLR